MNEMRRRTFARFFLIVLLAQFGLAAATWLLLNWGIRMWLQDRGTRLEAAAVSVAKSFTAAEVWAIPSGDTQSPSFTAMLDRLRGLGKEMFPRGDATMALFAVVSASPRPWLSIRVADYPPYAPDDGKPPSEQGLNDLACIQRVIGGASCFSPEPYGGAEAGEVVILSGYAPIRDSSGAVKAVVAVDGNVAPLATLQEATRTAFLTALVPALLLSALAAWFLTTRFVDPIEFLKDVQQAAARSQQPAHIEEILRPSVGEAAPFPIINPDGIRPPAGEAVPPEPPEVNAPSPYLSAVDARWDNLSEREKELVRYVGQALSTKEIAERMVVQEGTVKQHLKNIYRELDIHSREELVVIAVYKFGFIVRPLRTRESGTAPGLGSSN